MAYIYYNPNPKGKHVGDCVIRAISFALHQPWIATFIGIVRKGLSMCDMPSSNAVWAAYLRSNGFRAYAIPNSCPDCYTVRDFCMDNPYGCYILATGEHVVAIENGDYYDTWDSGDEIPIYYWKEIQ